ncbi:MAG: EAL domain-containing protein [Chloroflexi bacterium]|nr:EAL domain-containing protein [Chloroflexota bacterium]
MLIIDGEGNIEPLDQIYAGTWKISQPGRILSLNQRFSRLLEVPQSITDRLADENEMRRALEEKELVLFYQPQFSAQSGEIVGAEALLRWQHPTRGLISPDSFIPIAEETGFIVPLGEWVMQTACAQTKTWQNAKLPPITVAVNVSPRQFRERYLAPMIEQALVDSRLSPEWLEIEITEGTAMEDVAVSAAVLADLSKMGARISIDDFGTGYSSLGYLKVFSLHTLKIDRSFVDGVTTEPNDAAIAEAILAMAKALNLEVVAEGVETDEQLRFFRDRGCHRIQGFRLGKPMPADDFGRLLQDAKSLGDSRNGKVTTLSVNGGI